MSRATDLALAVAADPTTPTQEVTRLLQSLDDTDGGAASDVLPVVYQELRRLASTLMAAEVPGQTLQPTALVHEAWLRVAGEQHDWKSRRHFFSVAAEAMRRILLDRARKRRRIRHGGGQERIDIDSIDVAVEAGPEELLRVHEALDRLADEDPIKAELVKLRFFLGLRIPEAAEILGISATTAKRHWTFSRVWLYREINRD